MKRAAWTGILAAGVAALGAVWLGPGVPTGAEAAPEDDGTTLTSVGDTVPDFEAVTLDGKKIRGADLRGGVAVINLFATWCGSCTAEAPHLQKLWDRFHPQDERFQMLGIAREQTAEDIGQFRVEHKLTYPMAPDPDRKIYGLFATKWIPRTYVVDADGKIAFQLRGYTEEEFKELAAVVERELARAPVPRTIQ